MHLSSWRSNTCIHVSSFSSIVMCIKHWWMMKTAEYTVYKPYLDWRIFSSHSYKLIFLAVLPTYCKVCPMQYAEYPEDLVESIPVLKMWLLWWIWTLENSSTRWSDDILFLLVQYEIVLDYFNFIEPLIMLGVQCDICWIFPSICLVNHHTIIIDQSFDKRCKSCIAGHICYVT